MENNSMDLVHGAAIYQQDNFSIYNNMTSEEFLQLVLGPQRQDDEVQFAFLWDIMMDTYVLLLVSGNTLRTK